MAKTGEKQVLDIGKGKMRKSVACHRHEWLPSRREDSLGRCRRMPAIRPAALLCAVAVYGFGLPAHAAKFTEFDPQNSVATYPASISGGAIAGSYYDLFGDPHGFVRAADGSISTFDAPHASETYATGINKAGTVTGYYLISSGVEHGFAPFDVCTYDGGGCSFIRTADGTITVFTPDGSAGSEATSINASGAIAGIWLDGSDGGFHGYVRAAGGKITKFDPKGSTFTFVTSINEGGAITGWYDTGSTGPHGFVRAADGTITTFDAPQSLSTEGWSIDKAGTIAGTYDDSSRVWHGFVRTEDGTITTFDPSGSTNTSVWSIAVSGTVTGSYTDSSGENHGFVRTPAGRIISFDVPGASQTFPMSIDSIRSDRNVVTGDYEDSSGQYHGFIRAP